MRLLLAIVIVAALGARVTGSSERDELVVIVNAGNPERPAAAQLERVYLRKDVRWDNGEQIIPLNEPPDRDARHRFDHVVLGMSPDEAARYWLDQRIRGGVSAPREVGDAMLAVKLVARIKGAIAYVPADTELVGIRIVGRIRGDKLVPP